MCFVNDFDDFVVFVVEEEKKLTAEQKPKVEKLLEERRVELKELRKSHKQIKKELATKNEFADKLKADSPDKSQKETYTSDGETEENIEL